MAFNAPAVPVSGKPGDLNCSLKIRQAQASAKMAEVNAAFYEEAAQKKEFSSVFTPFKIDIPQYKVTVDKEKAKKMGVPSAAFIPHCSPFSEVYYVNDFNKFGKSYRVIIQADAFYRANKEDISQCLCQK